jgi:hypothetical protein
MRPRAREAIMEDMTPRRFKLSTTTPADRAPKFNVVVAFDDAESSSSAALKTCDYVISQLGGDIQVRRKVVNFDGATSPRSRAAAAKDAARADMVILSTRDHAALPSDMQAWLDEWTAHRSADEGALVAIFNGKDRHSARNGVRDQLAQLAQQMHMDFFTSEAAP